MNARALFTLTVLYGMRDTKVVTTLKGEKATHTHFIHQALKLYRQWPDGTKGLKW